jgi:hypothetical protein
MKWPKWLKLGISIKLSKTHEEQEREMREEIQRQKEQQQKKEGRK